MNQHEYKQLIYNFSIMLFVIFSLKTLFVIKPVAT